MALFQYIPINAKSVLAHPGKDLRTGRSIEQYRVSENALYIPVQGFSWKYLPLSEIRGVISGHIVEEGASKLMPYSKEKPILRVIHEGGVEVLELEYEKNQKLLQELLKQPV